VDSLVNRAGTGAAIAVSNVGNRVSGYGHRGSRDLLVVTDDYSVVKALHMYIGDGVAV
jgi:hypothetical protein